MKFLVIFLSNFVTFLITKPSSLIKCMLKIDETVKLKTMIYKMFRLDIQNLTKTKVMAIVVIIV